MADDIKRSSRHELLFARLMLEMSINFSQEGGAALGQIPREVVDIHFLAFSSLS